jgi:hypothetical protein
MKRRPDRNSKKKRAALAKARELARRREIDLRYMGLPKWDRRRIAEIGFRRWMNEVADAQLKHRARKRKSRFHFAPHARCFADELPHRIFAQGCG